MNKFDNAFAIILFSLILTITNTNAYAESKDDFVVPESFVEKTKNITKEKLEILDTSAVERLLGTKKRFYKHMESKTAEEIEAYIDGMIKIRDDSLFNPETDLASIPLNTESKGFNSWKVERPKSLNPKREPGPIHLSRYTSMRSGVKTFAGAPLAIYPDDLIAGNVDIAIVGAPLDGIDIYGLLPHCKV